MSDQTTNESPSPSAACSPSSDTPETDAFMERLHPTVRYPVYENELKRLERERNHARRLYETERLDHDFCQKTVKRLIKERDDAAELLAEIMRDEVNHQDEAEKWLRAYAPQHLFPENGRAESARNPRKER